MHTQIPPMGSNLVLSLLLWTLSILPQALPSVQQALPTHLQTQTCLHI